MSQTQPRIPVAAPVLDGREAEYVMECMTSGWISSNGRFIEDFERAFASYCGVKHAVATNNGTTALHLALVALDLHPGDEVLVPTLTYIASANAVRYCGGVPVLVDNEPGTMNISARDLESKITSRTRGIMPVHLFGHAADMDPIVDLARRHGLFVLEDAAEAVGATYRGRRTGGLGDCATFSFFGNKIITTGEGGMVTTNDDALADRLRLYRSQGMDPNRRYWFPVIGYNYRMTNIAAAIGLGQLERVEHHLAARRRIADGYDRRLAHLHPSLELPATEAWARHAYWMYVVRLGPRSLSRDRVMAAMDAEGVETRPVFHPLHTMPPYFEPSDAPYPHAMRSAQQGICLPTHGRLTEDDLDRIAQTLERALTVSEPAP